MIKGLGLQAHHLLEQRFRQAIALEACELAVALSAAEHGLFTQAYRDAIPYGGGCVTASQAINAAYDVYEELAEEYPELYAWFVELYAIE